MKEERLYIDIHLKNSKKNSKWQKKKTNWKKTLA
jgi:hypothetical protein